MRLFLVSCIFHVMQCFFLSFMCKKALDINKSIEWGLQVICVISVILFLFLFLHLLFFFLFISSYSNIFFGKALPSLWWRLPCTACKESRVRQPGASGFCYRVSVFCSKLARRASVVFWGNSNYRRIVINPANQKGIWG